MSSAVLKDLHYYRHTKKASYAGLGILAVVNNLTPLLFVFFHTQFQIPIAQLGALAALNFAVQFVTDFAAMFVIDKLGYRWPAVVGHVAAGLGLAALAVLPGWFDNPMVGLSLAVALYAFGGGLLEVLMSPIVEHLPVPTAKKSSSMALLHSFYCWGQLLVVLGTTGYLAFFGRENWQILPILWAILPLLNGLLFAVVPVPPTVPDGERTSLKNLFGAPLFMAALVLMMTGGAAELTMAQWSSFFAEASLGVSKQTGDLIGIGLFSVFMGLGRLGFGIWGERWDIRRTLTFMSLGAAACYVVASTSSNAVVSLLAVAICGFMISLLWPGTMSMTALRFPAGGAAMFAILALGGDGGATVGPVLAGFIAEGAVSGPFQDIAAVLPADGGSGLRTALLISTIVPLIYAAFAYRFPQTTLSTTTDD